MRLDKYLTALDIASRSQVKEMIRKKRIKVNGSVCNKADQHISEKKDTITLDGTPLKYQKFYYYMLNKPSGVVTANSDNRHKTVLDLLDVTPKKGLFPVGRLDKDTEGLLLITNDGVLAHKLLSPVRHVDKTYYVELDKALTRRDVALFQEGIDIGEKNKTKPAILEIVEKQKNQAYVTITEGKYHQIKRMFGKIGLRVTYLKRISMGTLLLDENLQAGAYRELTEQEIESLRQNAENYY